MNKVYIGWDNGTTGTIGIVGGVETFFVKTPIKTEQSYTKKKQNISRIDFSEVISFFMEHTKPGNRFALLERPMINGTRFKASMSGIRALEAQLLILEMLDIPYQYVDSKEWQRILLPKGTKGSAELKEASKIIGCRLFPEHKDLIIKHKDADGLLIAEWARRNLL